VDAGTTLVGSGGETILRQSADGGVYVGYADGSGLGAGQTLSLSLYSRVRANGSLRLAMQAQLAGPAPADPAILEAGPLWSTEGADLRVQLSTGAAVNISWRFHLLGRIVSLFEGTQQAVVGTDHSLKVLDFPGTFYALADLAALQAGDTVELRLKTRQGPGPAGTVRVAKYVSKAGAQAAPIAAIGPLVVADYVELTLKQTTGTARAIDWKLMRSS
jgi:hypothetical protein